MRGGEREREREREGGREGDVSTCRACVSTFVSLGRRLTFEGHNLCVYVFLCARKLYCVGDRVNGRVSGRGAWNCGRKVGG